VSVLSLRGIVKGYPEAGGRLEVLRGADLEIAPGEMVALVGPSGAGKSTLLHIAGLLEPPEAGEVVIAGVPCARAGDRIRTRLRRNAIGFIYQFHHLLPEYTALENVIVPQLIAGLDRREATQRAEELIRMVGLSPRKDHRPSELSGGEQQRTAIARALANAPRLLLADEPTGNLDPGTAEVVFSALRAVVSQTGLGALVATHNLAMAEAMDRTVVMRNGRLEER
jgi:lipoprotein-releasing system ATP-binding protein